MENNAVHSLHTKNGLRIRTLGELFEFINKADDDTFSHHFNSRQNDFADWVERSLKMKKLAKKMYAVKTRGKLYDLIKEEIEKSEDEPGLS